jgi:hypothetical protein
LWNSYALKTDRSLSTQKTLAAGDFSFFLTRAANEPAQTMKLYGYDMLALRFRSGIYLRTISMTIDCGEA